MKNYSALVAHFSKTFIFFPLLFFSTHYFVYIVFNAWEIRYKRTRNSESSAPNDNTFRRDTVTIRYTLDKLKTRMEYDKKKTFIWRVCKNM